MLIDSGFITSSLRLSGSYAQTGNSVITGSLTATQGITGSLLGTASFATNANSSSYAVNAGTAISSSFATNAANAFIQNGNSFGATALLGTNDAQNLAFETNGTVRMTITGSDGNVGIGTTTPSVGKVQINTVAASNNAITIQANSQTAITYGIGIDASSNFAIYDNFSAAQRITINGSGNVGIGTTNPTSRLFVSQSGADAGITVAGGTNPQIRAVNGTLITKIQSTSTSGFIGTETNNDLSIVTNNTSRLFISASGNVGIGSTSPATKLDIRLGSISVGTNDATEGTILLQDQYPLGHILNIGTNRSSGGPVIGHTVYPSNTNTNQFLSSVDNTFAWERSAFSMDGSFRWYTGAAQTLTVGASASLSQKMVLDNNGNLGIGTTGPSFPLSFGTALGNKIALYDGGSGTGYGFGIQSNLLQIFANGVADRVGIGYGNSTSFTETLSVKGSNVGIGTTSPGANLQIGNANISTSSMLRLSVNYAGGADPRGAVSWHDTANTTGQIDTRFDGTKVNMHFGSLYNSGYNSTVRMTILGDGNVGIGTIVPAYNLHVSSSSGPTIMVQSANNIGAQFRAKNTAGEFVKGIDGSGNGGWMDYDVTNSQFVTYYRTGSAGFYAIYTNGGERITINGSGNVGIGTTSPAVKLDVVGRMILATATAGLYVYTSGSSFTDGIRIGDISTDNGFMYLAYVSQSKYGSIQPGDNITYRNLNLNHQGGNVGIGFLNPTGKLHVSSSTSINHALRIEAEAASDTFPVVYIEGNKSGGAPAVATLVELKSNTDARGRGIHMTVADGNTRWFAGVPYLGGGYQIGYDGSANAIPFYPASSSLFITTGGSVGIGLSNPNNKLVVNGAIGFSSASVLTPFAQRSSFYHTIYEPAGGVALYLGNTVDPGNYHDNTNHYFRNRGGGTTYAIINSAGSVGIGTTSPSEELHVYGNANATVAARIENINAGASAFSTIQLGSAIGGNPNRWLNIGYSSVGVAAAGPYHPTGSFIINYGNGGLSLATTGSNAGTSHIKFFTSGGAFGTERMRIEEAGNVGINLGSTAASARLHVSGTFKTDQPLGGVTVADSYRWGSVVVTTGLTLLTTRYIEVDIGGTLRRVALVA
jgi:hypothetical protein